MTAMNVDFIFDFASPNAYLCHKAITELEKNHEVKFNYIPCLLGGIFKLTNNQAPMIAFGEIPNKMKYEFDTAFNRFLKQHQIENFCMNEHFPVNTLLILRGAIVAQKNNFFESYVDVVMIGMWERSLRLDNAETLHELLTQYDCPADLLIEQISNPEIKAELINNTNKAVEKGVFGIPSFFIDDELYFGKESLREIKDMLLESSETF